MSNQSARSEFYIRIFEIYREDPTLGSPREMNTALLDRTIPSALAHFIQGVKVGHFHWALESLAPPRLIHIYYDGPKPSDEAISDWSELVADQVEDFIDRKGWS